MKLLTKLYFLLLPVIIISMSILVFTDVKDFNKRVDEFQNNYINKGIEDSLDLASSPLFYSYFDNLEYDLLEEAKVVEENIKSLFIQKIEINNKYSKSLKNITFLSNKKELIVSSDNKIKQELTSYIKDKDIYKEVESKIINNQQVILVALSSNSTLKSLKKEEIKGFLLVINKLYIEDIEELKEEILIRLVFQNIFLLLSFIFIIYLISKKIAKPIKELSKQVQGLSKSENKKLSMHTDIEEFLFLCNTISTLSSQMISKQKSIQDLNLTLEEKVFTRTEELEESTYELEESLANLKKTQNILIESEKMASLGGLVAGVAHEINTPIGIGVTGITHLKEITYKIKENYDNNNLSEEEFSEYLNTSSEIVNLIHLNLEKTSHLVRSFKQISVDQTSEELREFNLKEYINEILFSINNITRKTNININVICDENIEIISYPGSYSQIISNLVLNSINHAYKKDEKGTITIECKCEKDLLEIKYSDDGKGINEKNLKKVFDPFFTTNRNSGGTGLGLNIIYNIVTNNLKGTITCSSKENNGVLFTLLLKLSF